MSGPHLQRQHLRLMLLAAGNQLGYAALVVCVLIRASIGDLLGCVGLAVVAGFVYSRSRFYLMLAEVLRVRIERTEGGQ